MGKDGVPNYRRLNIPLDGYVAASGSNGALLSEPLRPFHPLARTRKSLKESMDVDATEKWPRRLLLWAEPQVGKTGAFLQLLSEIGRVIAREQVCGCRSLCGVLNAELTEWQVVTFIPQVPDSVIAAISTDDFFPRWFYPERAHMDGLLREYNELSTGKYHKTVAGRRLDALKAAGSVAGPRYRDGILAIEGPLSQSGWDRLRALPADSPLPNAVNWDGFLHREFVKTHMLW